MGALMAATTSDGAVCSYTDARNQTAHPIDTFLDQRVFLLDAETYDAFQDALDQPPGPGSALKALMKRQPPWRS